MSFPRYTAYKDSGVEWLGEIPEHWEIKPIKRIVSTPVTDGPHETPNFLDAGIPFVSAEAVAKGHIEFEKVRGFISEADHARFAEKYFPKMHDIFLVKAGATTGVTAIVETDRPFNIWSPLAAIRVGSEANPYFVLNYLRSKNFQEAVILNWSFGTQQNIGMGVIQNLAVALPPYSEQSAIAAFLKRETMKIDTLVDEQRRLIDLLREKRQAVISHAVTKGLDPNVLMKNPAVEWLDEVPEHWEVVPFKIIIARIESGTSVNATDSPAEPGELGVLKTSCVYRGEFDAKENKAVVADEHHRVTCPLRAGSLIVSRMNTPELVGAAGLVKTAPQNLYLPDRLWQVHVGEANSAFVYYWTLSLSYRSQVQSACSGTSSSMQNLSQDQLRAFSFPMPPMGEQTEIVYFS